MLFAFMAFRLIRVTMNIFVLKLMRIFRQVIAAQSTTKLLQAVQK